MELSRQKLIFGALVIVAGLVVAKAARGYAAKNPDSLIAKHLV